MQHVHKLPGSGRESPRKLIRLTPLIDVVFILLVFFMLVSSFDDWRSVSLDGTAEAPGVSDARPVLVRIRGEGALIVNGAVIDVSAFGARLAEIFQGGAPSRIVLHPAAGVVLQEVVTVSDIARASGATEIMFVRD